MAILRNKDALKLSPQDRDTKIDELKMELIKANVTAQKAKAKTKEIKRTLARLYTMKNANKNQEEVAKK